jgi:hypothetical protein
MRRIAELPTPWRYLVYALLLLLLFWFLRWIDRHPPEDQAAKTTVIHIKYRPGIMAAQVTSLHTV